MSQLFLILRLLGAVEFYCPASTDTHVSLELNLLIRSLGTPTS